MANRIHIEGSETLGENNIPDLTARIDAMLSLSHEDYFSAWSVQDQPYYMPMFDEHGNIAGYTDWQLEYIPPSVLEQYSEQEILRAETVYDDSGNITGYRTTGPSAEDDYDTPVDESMFYTSKPISLIPIPPGSADSPSGYFGEDSALMFDTRGYAHHEAGHTMTLDDLQQNMSIPDTFYYHGALIVDGKVVSKPDDLNQRMPDPWEVRRAQNIGKDPDLIAANPKAERFGGTPRIPLEGVHQGPPVFYPISAYDSGGFRHNAGVDWDQSHSFGDLGVMGAIQENIDIFFEKGHYGKEFFQNDISLLMDPETSHEIKNNIMTNYGSGTYKQESNVYGESGEGFVSGIRQGVETDFLTSLTAIENSSPSIATDWGWKEWSVAFPDKVNKGVLRNLDHNDKKYAISIEGSDPYSLFQEPFYSQDDYKILDSPDATYRQKVNFLQKASGPDIIEMGLGAGAMKMLKPLAKTVGFLGKGIKWATMSPTFVSRSLRIGVGAMLGVDAVKQINIDDDLGWAKGIEQYLTNVSDPFLAFELEGSYIPGSRADQQEEIINKHNQLFYPDGFSMFRDPTTTFDVSAEHILRNEKVQDILSATMSRYGNDVKIVRQQLLALSSNQAIVDKFSLKGLDISDLVPAFDMYQGFEDLKHSRDDSGWGRITGGLPHTAIQEAYGNLELSIDEFNGEMGQNLENAQAWIMKMDQHLPVEERFFVKRNSQFATTVLTNPNAKDSDYTINKKYRIEGSVNMDIYMDEIMAYWNPANPRAAEDLSAFMYDINDPESDKPKPGDLGYGYWESSVWPAKWQGFQGTWASSVGDKDLHTIQSDRGDIKVSEARLNHPSAIETYWRVQMGNLTEDRNPLSAHLVWNSGYDHMFYPMDNMGIVWYDSDGKYYNDRGDRTNKFKHHISKEERLSSKATKKDGYENDISNADYNKLITTSGNGSFEGYKFDPSIYKFADIYNNILQNEEIIYSSKGGFPDENEETK